MFNFKKIYKKSKFVWNRGSKIVIQTVSLVYRYSPRNHCLVPGDTRTVYEVTHYTLKFNKVCNPLTQ